MHLFLAAAKCDSSGSNAFINSSNLPHTCANNDTLHAAFLILFGIIGALAFLFLVIGGLRYITAGGNPESVQKAKNQIQHALIGLIIIAMAGTVVAFIINLLKK